MVIREQKTVSVIVRCMSDEMTANEDDGETNDTLVMNDVENTFIRG